MMKSTSSSPTPRAGVSSPRRRPQDLEGRPVDVIIHPDAYAAGRERRQLILNCARALKDVPLKLIGLDGQTRHVVVDAHPLVVDGVVQGAMVVANPSSL